MSDELERFREALLATTPRPSAAARERAAAMAAAAFDDQRQGIRQPVRQKDQVPKRGARRLVSWLRGFSMQIPRPALALTGTAVAVIAAGLVFRQALLPPSGLPPAERAAPAEVSSRSLGRGLSPPPRAGLEPLPAETGSEPFSPGGQVAERSGQASPERESERRFQDCPACPELIVVPAGSFMMGSPSGEAGRLDNEGPVRRVVIAESFAIGVHEVTRGEYARFVQAADHEAGSSCRVQNGESGAWTERPGASWRSPGFEQTDRHPVVCVSWEDAQAYVQWLSGKTGHAYRLPSESEWEYAARAGTGTPRYWGAAAGPCEHANGAEAACADGHVRTSPVGTFAANGFGLHDVLGNTGEWVQDCWHEGYGGAPAGGKARESGDCGERVLRGGSWRDGPERLRAANRYGAASGMRSSAAGFRVLRGLSP